MDQDEILNAWRKTIKVGDRVRHIADWQVATVIGMKTHPVYDFELDFGGPYGNSQVYVRNLFPEWWPAPNWAKKALETR
jgi:hypothetical protein